MPSTFSTDVLPVTGQCGAKSIGSRADPHTVHSNSLIQYIFVTSVETITDYLFTYSY